MYPGYPLGPASNRFRSVAKHAMTPPSGDHSRCKSRTADCRIYSVNAWTFFDMSCNCPPKFTLMLLIWIITREELPCKACSSGVYKARGELESRSWVWDLAAWRLSVGAPWRLVAGKDQINLILHSLRLLLGWPKSSLLANFFGPASFRNHRVLIIQNIVF